jgi:hypothetical protein
MRVEVEIPEGPFRGPKTEREVAAELREAGAMYWLARGEIEAPDAERVVARGRRFKDFKEALLAMPNVGDDADFERSAEVPKDED